MFHIFLQIFDQEDSLTPLGTSFLINFSKSNRASKNGIINSIKKFILPNLNSANHICCPIQNIADKLRREDEHKRTNRIHTIKKHSTYS